MPSCLTSLLLTISFLTASRIHAVSMNPSFNTSVPLFAHIRWANFSSSDLQSLLRFRSITVQVEPDAPLPCEIQASNVRTLLHSVANSTAPAPPVFMYGNLFYSEPNCNYNSLVMNNSWLWLNQSNNQPYMPGGRYTFDLSTIEAQQWWVQHVILNSTVDGGFGDGGCGGTPPNWLNQSHGIAFAQGQLNTHRLATEAIYNLNNNSGSDGLYIVNCPVLPQINDPYINGTRAYMIESWCSDFQPAAAGTATFCRDELLEALVLGTWGNISLQARYYLNKDNAYNPEYGLASFMIAAWDGAYFGASRDWDWDGDWANLLTWPWASRIPGIPKGPATMEDPDGCGWSRSFPNANVTIDLCGKHMRAVIAWAGDAESKHTEKLFPPQHQDSERNDTALSPSNNPLRRHRAHPTNIFPLDSSSISCPFEHATVFAPWSSTGYACIGFKHH